MIGEGWLDPQVYTWKWWLVMAGVGFLIGRFMWWTVKRWLDKGER